MSRFFALSSLLLAFALGAAAQEEVQGGSASGLGKVQVSVVLGNNPMFNQSTSYLLPTYSTSNAVTGLYNEAGYYLNLGNVGSNSLVNMVGVQGAYFITDNIDVNAMFSMNISSSPKKDYREGFDADNNVSVPASRALDGKLTNNWFANVGGNYHFATSNKLISAYAGVRAGMQMGRIQTTTPYTGNVEGSLYFKENKCGQLRAYQGAIMAGVDCTLACGVVLGIEVAPVAYQYSTIEIDPDGFYHYECENHGIKAFSTPTFKLGFRF